MKWVATISANERTNEWVRGKTSCCHYFVHLGNYEREEWQKNSATVDKIPASAAVLVCMGADSRIHHYPNSALAADYYDKSCPPRRLFADYSSLRMTGRTKVRCAVKSAPFNTGSFPPWHPLLLFAISGKQESLILWREIFFERVGDFLKSVGSSSWQSGGGLRCDGSMAAQAGPNGVRWVRHG